MKSYSLSDIQRVSKEYRDMMYALSLHPDIEYTEGAFIVHGSVEGFTLDIDDGCPFCDSTIAASITVEDWSDVNDNECNYDNIKRVDIDTLIEEMEKGNLSSEDAFDLCVMYNKMGVK